VTVLHYIKIKRNYYRIEIKFTFQRKRITENCTAGLPKIVTNQFYPANSKTLPLTKKTTTVVAYRELKIIIPKLSNNLSLVLKKTLERKKAKKL